MKSRTLLNPRLLTLLVAIALLVSLAASAGPAQAAPKKCPKGKTAWKLDGRAGCVPRAKLGAGKAPAASAMARTWLANAARPALGSRTRLAPSLRRAVPRAGRALAKGVARVGAARSSARVAQRGPVVERHEGVVGRLELGDGAFVEGRIRARVYEDDSKEFDAEIEMQDGKGNTLRYAPKLDDLVQTKPVGCPTAAGVVTVAETAEMAGTVVRLRKGRVRGAKTVRDGWRIDARGQVGTDARLRSVAADVTMTMKVFERGLQQQTTLSAAVSLSREGAPVLKGTPTVSVSVKAAGATRAEEREYETTMARVLAGAPEIAAALSSMGVRARSDLLEAERGWYDLPNDCAQLAWTPETGGELAVDETRRVTGQVIARRDGGVATGSISVGQVSPGRLIPIAPAFSPSAPASFIAAGGVPDPSGNSVYAQAVATSTAGRAQRVWSARGKPVSLPQAFRGTVAATSTTTGMKREFSGSAGFARTSIVRGPDGSLTAWYELTSASLGQAKQILGAFEGCRYEANGSGGYVDSGDLELRVLPGGEVVYALLYDLKVDSSYVPTDCPPDSGDPFAGEIAAFLDTRRPGPVESQLRPAGDGYRLEAAGVSDVTAEAGIATTASWSLMPE
jgi:hypothetical protein